MNILWHRLEELLRAARLGGDSEYKRGYIHAMEDAIELVETYAWEVGEDVGD